MKKITAKFNSHCAGTGAIIKKGESMYYDYYSKKCYSLSYMDSKEDKNLSDYISAQEDSYFDNFCQNNNI